jgi:hypothetical protein
MHHPDIPDLSPVTGFFSRMLRPDGSGRLVHAAVRPTAVIWWIKEQKSG